MQRYLILTFLIFISLSWAVHEGYAQEEVDSPTTENTKGVSVVKVLLLILIGGAIVGIFIIAFVKKGKKGEANQSEMIRASLVDIRNVTGKKIHYINKETTTIGRVKSNDVDIRIPKNTISAAHAQIEYKNHNFYITDLRSRNGTYLNEIGKKITDEVCLKNRDIIIFDQYRFRFSVSSQIKRRGMGSSTRSDDETILRLS